VKCTWNRGRVANQRLTRRCFVRGVIIHDDVHLQVLRDVLFNLPEKTQIFLMPVTRSTFREHFAVRRIQRGKQRSGSVASIIVGHSFDITQSQRQHRLGAFQCLNSALLIDAQNHSIFRGIQIQPYHIPYFFYKKWIAGELEMFLLMWLQAKRLPDAMYVNFDTPVSSAI
jgi:hypothetical protein